MGVVATNVDPRGDCSHVRDPLGSQTSVQQYSSEELLAMLNDTGVIEIDQKELAK